jgi:membrane protein implicated in regulation of membrane protease activity
MTTKAPTSSSNAGEFLKTNSTLLVWFFFLALGGGLLALYYARIGYLPDIEWRYSLVYLAVVSFIGGAFGLLELLAVFLPGFIWAEILICDPHIIGKFCQEEKGAHEPSINRIFKYLGIPFGISLVISHVALYFGIWAYMGAVVLILGCISCWMWKKFSSLIDEREKENEHQPEKHRAHEQEKHHVHEKKTEEQQNHERKHRLWKYVFWFDLSVLLSHVAVLLIYYIAWPKGPQDLWPYSKLTCLCIFGVLVSNHIVAARYWIHRRRTIIACLIISLLLFVAADHFAPLSTRIMALYGFGREDNKVRLLVNNDGANLIENLGLPNNTCGQAGRNTLCGVEILSGIGSEYFIKLDGTTFTLPKSMVISRSAKAR